MAHAPEEVVEMARISSSLVLNIGTLTVGFVDAMKKAARAANKENIPVVLDACGAGATSLRDKKCQELIKEVRIDIIKGNASEIARVAGMNVKTKGVDSSAVKTDIKDFAVKLAIKNRCTVVVTGETDIVTDGKRCFMVTNGHKIMASLVGTGCMATSVIGVFAAVESDLTKASIAGLVCFEVAAELAAKESLGPGSFKEKFFDHLYKLDAKTISRLQKVRC
jgi:hydroxyethylthiazole kinase